ncbi:unnamed protein product [Victoria cruziana]
MARTIEEKNRRIATLRKPFRQIDHGSSSSANHKPLPPPKEASRIPLLTAPQPHYITRQEREECIKKGLCFNCDEKWERGHKCKHLKMFIVQDNEDEEDQPPEEEHEENDEGEPYSLKDVICHAMSDMRRPNSMRIAGYVGERRVMILLDTGSTLNFLSVATMETLGYPSLTHPTFTVMVGDGARLECTHMCKDLPLMIQNVVFQEGRDGTVFLTTLDTPTRPKGALQAMLDPRPACWALVLVIDTQSRTARIDVIPDSAMAVLPDSMGMTTESAALPPARSYDPRSMLTKGASFWAHSPLPAFERLQAAMPSTLTLSLPNFIHDFIMQTDDQREWENSILETYFQVSTRDVPTMWTKLLSKASQSSDTNQDPSFRRTPHDALYGHVPLSIPYLRRGIIVPSRSLRQARCKEGGFDTNLPCIARAQELDGRLRRAGGAGYCEVTTNLGLRGGETWLPRPLWVH